MFCMHFELKLEKLGLRSKLKHSLISNELSDCVNKDFTYICIYDSFIVS